MSAWLTRWQASTPGMWFASQSLRDQRVLIVLAVFLLACAVYLGLWSPVRQAHQQAEQRYARELSDQQWIIANFAALERATTASAGAGSGRALLGTVATAARRAELSLNRFQPEGDDALAVAIDDVEFGALMLWLENLARDEGIRVRRASIDPRESAGRVRARIVLY